MIARNATETEFKRLTTDEYLQGGYGLDREQPEELAAQEWSIRQEVEGVKLRHARLKESNPRHGFGKNAILIKREKKSIVSSTTRNDIKSANAEVKTETKPKPKRKKTAVVDKPQEYKEFRVSTDALKALQTKAVLTYDDITVLFSGDAEFLSRYAQSLNFPKFEPRINGYRSWKVYDWIGTYAKRKKIRVRL